MSEKVSEVWGGFVAFMVVVILLIVLICVSAQSLSNEVYRENSERHYADVSRCQELEGTITYGHNGWFKSCAVAP